MQVAMLGPLEVRTGAGDTVRPVTGGRLRALLVLLALRPGQLVPVSQLIDDLWGDQPPAGATNALQSLVSRLRRAVPEAEVIARPSGYQLVLDPAATDIAGFERLAADGRARLRDNPDDPDGAATVLREALALWRGPALVDVAGSQTGQAVAARLEELRLSALEDRVTADLRLGRHDSMIAELEELVSTHPTRESLAGLLMRALLACGRRAAALEVYERLRETLADQLGADPSPELAAVHLDALRADEPAPRPTTNLPAGLTSFLGRDAELKQVAGLLSGHRLVTLTGPGGSGKTRLAIEAAWAELPTTPDGVWLVELAPVTDPTDVVATMLAALGLREQMVIYPGRTTGTDALGRLLSALSGQRALLVLDNCEHLVNAAATLAERILTSCPGMRILATSREPLNITGEALVPVHSLTDEAAIRLLTERARAVAPDFELADTNTQAVARICRALDGMPLAIELAAARLRTMVPEQVAARLDDRFRLLTGGSRTAMPRHQTLRAVVDWSWDLLDDTERALCRRMSVFTGGATLEAAEQVCSATIELLTALADKSLVVIRDSRYHMLEIIRAYGRERLAEAGGLEDLRKAHARYFLQLAGRGARQLRGGEQLSWLRRLSQDQDNLHTALRGAASAGDPGTAVGLAAALGWYWWLLSMKIEGRDLTAEALGVPRQPGDVPDDTLAMACLLGALLSTDTPPETVASQWFAAAADLVERLSGRYDPALRVAPPFRLAFGLPELGPPEVFDEIARDPDPWVAALARMMRANVALNFGRPPATAEADFLTAADIFGALGERWGLASSLTGVAVLEGQRGEHAGAAEHFRRAMELAAELGTSEDVTNARLGLARQLWLLGDRDQAHTELRRALRDADHLGLPELAGLAVCTSGDLARLEGDPDSARAYLTRALEISDSPGGSRQVRARALTVLGYLMASGDDLAAARDCLLDALATALPLHDAPVIAGVVTGFAQLALREGDPERAATLLGASMSVRGSTDRSALDEEQLATAARRELGEPKYGEAFQRGQHVTMDALAALDPLIRPAGGTPAPPAERTRS